MHAYFFLIVYVLYVIVAMILCVDFGASDCDCEECYSPKYQGKWFQQVFDLFVIQYYALAWLSFKNHSLASCMHAYFFLIVYVLYVIVAMILCVDFGASDCDCEECYSPKYQGKWYS